MPNTIKTKAKEVTEKKYCKIGCERIINPGKTAKDKNYDTCCALCVKKNGNKHDSFCDKRNNITENKKIKKRKLNETFMEMKKPLRKKRKSEKENNNKNHKFNLNVDQHESILIVSPLESKNDHNKKIASFDMDSTILKPKSGFKFPKGRKDWVFLYGNVKAHLKKLYDDGFKVVIFTNQNGIGKGNQSAADIYGKIMDLSEVLGIPLIAFISTMKDNWRKPNVTMWDYFLTTYNGEYNSTLKLDKSSFYCGDAAGRVAAWNGDKKTKKDFSCSDRKFAYNIGIKFLEPEELFLGNTPCPKMKWGFKSFDPKKFMKQFDESKSNEIKNWYHGNLTNGKIHRSGIFDAVIMVGCPGSGKSSFVKRFLVKYDYVWINRDTLKTKSKCKKALNDALEKKKNVVIDNTNSSARSRSEFLEILEKFHITSIRCMKMNSDFEMAKHMNCFREYITNGKSKRVPDIAYNIYKKNFEEPEKSEGFTEIVTIDFCPFFQNERDKIAFLNWT